jgi:peptidyl-prolyl cis-trans isomerase C/foldase protein PrsA
MKKRYFLAAVLLLALLAAGCQSGSQAQSKIIAEVNGDKITQTEFDQHLKLLKFTYEKQVLGTGKLDTVKDKETISKLEEQSYKEMILQKLLEQEAEKEKIQIKDSEVDEALKDQDIEAFLEDSGMEEKYFRQEMKTQLLYWKIRDKVTAKIKVDDAEAQKYYQDNIDYYTEPAGMQVSHILVATEKEALDILAQLKAGSDFAELAQQSSTCPSKEVGGDLGTINEESNLDATFKEAALKLQPGEITQEPVKTDYGYHLIKAGDKVETKVHPFEEVKNSVVADLEQQKKDKAFGEYLENLNKNAEVKDLRK